MGQYGYFSCDQTCDFDMCVSCVTCSGDGSLLFETYEIPSEDTIKWQQFCQRTTSENYFETDTASTQQTQATQGTGGCFQIYTPRMPNKKDRYGAASRQKKPPLPRPAKEQAPAPLNATCSRCSRVITKQEMKT